jgi:hypothetical protein
MNTAFYDPSDSEFTRHYRDEVQMVFSGIDCILHGGEVIYCSSELTSGFTLRKALLEHGVKSAAELKQQMGIEWFKKNIWDTNVRAAVDFAEEVRAIDPDKTFVITPAPFSAPGWSDHEYLAFWESLLRTRVRVAWFNRNWQYSNGCAFEFAVARDAGLSTYDYKGQMLDRETGMTLLEEAIKELESEGLDTRLLRENLVRLSQSSLQNPAARARN